MVSIPGTPEAPWSLLPPCCTPSQTDLGSASPHSGNTHGRYCAHTDRRGHPANTCCCRRSCLFIAQTHPYFLETKEHTVPHTVPHTQLLGWRVQQLFTLWTLRDVQSSTECFMLCSTNHKSH